MPPTEDTPRIDFTDDELAAYRERRYAQQRRTLPRRDLIPAPPGWRDRVRAALERTMPPRAQGRA